MNLLSVIYILAVFLIGVTTNPITYEQVHEHDVLNFNDRANLSRFLQEAANADLFVNLRVGPYICSETSFMAQSNT